jgi:hypothetical protein
MTRFHSFYGRIIFPCAYIYPIFFIHLLLYDWFYISAIGFSATVNMGVQILPWYSNFIFFGYLPRSGISGWYSRSIFSFYLFVFAVLGGWTQGLTLFRQALDHLSHFASPFCFVYFWDIVSLYAQVGLDYNPPVCASCVAGVTGALPYPAQAGFESWSSWFLHPE